MTDLDYRPFDADNHYYEAVDAFTRHVPDDMKARCVQWATIDGRQHHIVGGKLARAVKNPTWNPISFPGSIAPFLHGKELSDEDIAYMKASEPLPDYYMNRDARVAKLEEQGLGNVTQDVVPPIFLQLKAMPLACPCWCIRITSRY